jgi:hypothetical protein
MVQFAPERVKFIGSDSRIGILLVEVRKCDGLGALGACPPSQARFAPSPTIGFLNPLFSGRFFDKPLGSVEKPTNRAGN